MTVEDQVSGLWHSAQLGVGPGAACPTGLWHILAWDIPREKWLSLTQSLALVRLQQKPSYVTVGISLGMWASASNDLILNEQSS